jgi:hypothetical protein
MKKSIGQIKEIVKKLGKEERERFDRIFSFYVSESRMTVPEKMKLKLAEKFDIPSLEKQEVVRIDNKVTGDAAIFNPLRGRRPMQKSEENPDLSQKDDFCNPIELTPYDEIGRIENKSAITAANLAKYGEFHSLVILKKHDPFSISYEEFSDAIAVALEWFQKTRKKQKAAVYPFLIWNFLWKSAASIIHPHFQILLSRVAFPSQSFFEKTIKNYRAETGDDYIDDFFRVHESFGLAFRIKNARVISPLTPVKEKEVIVTSEKLDENFIKSLFRVFKTYMNLGVESFNLALIMPSLDSSLKIPYIARFVDRGKLSVKTSDFGAMEIYSGARVVSSDPFEVVEALKNLKT